MYCKGEHQFLMVLCRMLYPKASADEIIAFIMQHSVNPVEYTRGDISKREKELGFTRKVGSTTANQAMTPANLQRPHLFWNTNFPSGVVGTPRQRLIDIDEAGLWIEKSNRKHGKAPPGVRVREAGPYGHSEKWTLILGIDCAGRKVHSYTPFPPYAHDQFTSPTQPALTTLPQVGLL